MAQRSAVTVPAMDVFRANVWKHIERGLAISKLARMVNRSHPTLSALLHGHSGNATVKTASDIAEALDVPLYQLFNPEYEPADDWQA